MTITNILFPKAPTIAGIEFDAVLEDTLVSEVQNSGYTIELGARASDHRIIMPKKWTLTVGISNNPLKVQLTDFVGAASYLDTNSGLLAATVGLSAGILAGSNETRSSSALNTLLELQTSGEPFNISAGDIDLTSMVIDKITRTKDASNESGLIAICELSESPRLATILAINSPALSTLNPEDSAYTSAVGNVDKGELSSTTYTGSLESFLL